MFEIIAALCVLAILGGVLFILNECLNTLKRIESGVDRQAYLMTKQDRREQAD